MKIMLLFYYIIYSNYTGPEKTMAKRYVPPGARSKETAGSTTKNAEDSQRSLDDIAQDAGGAVFTVKLRSENTYSKYNMCIHVVFIT